MARFAKGSRALAISDRSGAAFPYREMVREWTGAWVHISEFEPKQPQLEPHPVGADPQGLLHASCLLYTSPSPRDRQKSRMPSSA